MRLGTSALSARELLAVVLGVGAQGRSALSVAGEILSHVGELGALAAAQPMELAVCRGIGQAQSLRICAAVELGRRTLDHAQPRDGPIAGPKDVYQRLRVALGDLEQEVFVVLALDARNRVTQQLEIARGSLTGVDVHPREIFRPLIRRGAAATVVAHNHPSGDYEPSSEDIELTRRLFAAGEILGIPVLDHLIVARGGYCSIAERLAP